MCEEVRHQAVAQSVAFLHRDPQGIRGRIEAQPIVLRSPDATTQTRAVGI
jgi:hypothetical protein